MKTALLLLFIIPCSLNPLFAQIYSTPTGGLWADPGTWIGGIVPGSDDNVIIQGNVYATSNACHDLTITNPACFVSNVTSGNGSITVYGDLTNYGTICNSALGRELTLNLYGNLHAGNNVYPQTLNFLGTGSRSLSCDGSYAIAAAASITVASTVDTLYAASNITIGLTSAVPPLSLTGVSELCIISLLNPYLGTAFDMSMNNCGLYNVEITGNGADSVSFNNNDTSVYIQNTSIENLSISGTLRIHNGNSLNNTVNNGIIYNYHNLNHSLSAYGTFVNNGLICSNPSGYNLYLVSFGDLINNGTMQPYHLYISGDGDRTLQCTPTTPFNPIGNIYVAEEVDNIYAGSDLYFTNFDGIRGHFSLFAYDTSRTSRNLHFTGVEIENSDIVAGASSALYGTDLLLIDTNLTGFRLEGDISFHGSCSLTDAVNYAVLQNHNSMNYDLDIYGNFSNYGTVRNNPSGYNFTINAYDDVLNYGSWSCNTLNMYGDDVQSISFGSGHSFAGAYLYDMNSAAGLNVVDDDLYLNNSNWDLNSVSLSLTPGNYDLILSNSVIAECAIISNLNSNLNMTGSSRIGSVTFQSITNTGTLMFYTDTTFSGDLVNNGLVQNYSNFNKTLTVQGNITNSGTFQNNPSGYYLYVNLVGNAVNTGIWNNYSLSLTGSGAQLISFPAGHGFLGSCFYDTNAASQLYTNADLYFVNTSIDLNGAALELLAGGFDLSLDNCSLTDAVVHSDESTVLYSVNNTRIYSSSFESITTDGIVNLGSNTTLSGNLTNLGTIQNNNSSYYSLYVRGNLDNHGTMRNNPSGYHLVLYCSNHLTNSGTINVNSITFDGVTNQNIDNSGTILVQNLTDTSSASTITLLTDLVLTNTQVDLNGSTMVLNTGTRDGKTLTMHGGFLREIIISGGNGSRLICDSNAYITEFNANELIVEGTILIYGNTTFGHLINNGIIMNHPNYYYTLNVSQRLDNYATIADNYSYNLYLTLNGDLYDYGFISNNYIDFVANANQSIYQDASADTISCASIRKSSSSGNLILLSNLRVKGCFIDLYSKNLEMYSGRASHKLSMDGGYITRTFLATSGFSTLAMSGDAYLNGIDGGNLIFQGTVIIVSTSHFNSVTNYATLRNSPSFYSYLYMNGNFTNYGTITQVSFSFYLYIAGNFANYGTAANQQISLNGNTDQDVILSGIQTCSYLTLVSNNGNSVWFRDSVNTHLTGTSINITPSDPQLYGLWQPFNTSNGIWGRYISITMGSAVTAPENLQIMHSGTSIILQWNQVTNATAYNLYASDAPDAGFVIMQMGVIDPNPGDGIVQYSLPDGLPRKFFKVTALN